MHYLTPFLAITLLLSVFEVKAEDFALLPEIRVEKVSVCSRLFGMFGSRFRPLYYVIRRGSIEKMESFLNTEIKLIRVHDGELVVPEKKEKYAIFVTYTSELTGVESEFVPLVGWFTINFRTRNPLIREKTIPEKRTGRRVVFRERRVDGNRFAGYLHPQETTLSGILNKNDKGEFVIVDSNGRSTSIKNLLKPDTSLLVKLK